ncbi:hypothetical protein CKAH01_09027 [Colletotrichum kahawae]|uniref:Secreted protein n=1 Tax=Colletotrichum kahawae TaxID=34407 RepID=A0AAD9XZM2_COLKA|nr:hypothetical protein CKAH01_09027 [Colletotrichum kahawae]
MKVEALLLVCLAATSFADGIGGKKPKMPNDPLPLHELPECIRRCAKSEGHKGLGFDYNTIKQKDWCAFDPLGIRGTWIGVQFSHCVNECPLQDRRTWWDWSMDLCGKEGMRGDTKFSPGPYPGW